MLALDDAHNCSDGGDFSGWRLVGLRAAEPPWLDAAVDAGAEATSAFTAEMSSGSLSGSPPSSAQSSSKRSLAFASNSCWLEVADAFKLFLVPVATM